MGSDFNRRIVLILVEAAWVFILFGLPAVLIFGKVTNSLAL